jgi:hypothetical protein
MPLANLAVGYALHLDSCPVDRDREDRAPSGSVSRRELRVDLCRRAQADLLSHRHFRWGCINRLHLPQDSQGFRATCGSAFYGPACDDFTLQMPATVGQLLACRAHRMWETVCRAY